MYSVVTIKRALTPYTMIYCKGKKAIARGEYTEDGLIVFAGSTCNMDETKSLALGIRKKRQKLLQNNILVIVKDVYSFEEDYIFPSPSQASDVVLGRSSNGWDMWKYENGKTLDEVMR